MTRPTDRYARTFARLAERQEGMFVPFTVLGDPDAQRSRAILRALVRGGADALELGIPFSDPVADGPTIQAADVRALKAGIRPDDAFALVAELRAEEPEIPIGLLVYANLVETHGADAFYRRAARAGVDSVLIADVPTLEIDPYLAAAERAGILPVLIATPGASETQLTAIAKMTRGYTYTVTRVGVTGADDERAELDHVAQVARLKKHDAPPALLGFGISRPEHVRAALAAGAAGAISGSAIVRLIEAAADDASPARLATLETELETFVRQMKAATRREGLATTESTR